jgi:hypothetical protein
MQKVDLNEGDVLRGDPVKYVVGGEEKPARRHAPQPPKPPAPKPLTLMERAHRDVVDYEWRLLTEVKMRKAELQPLVEEVPLLEEALRGLEGI